MDDRSQERFLLVGGGVAALAAAVFLIRDAAVPGHRIRILEARGRPGGALVSGRAPDSPALFLGNAVRGMVKGEHACLFDLLGSVPTLTDPGRSLLDDVNEARPDRLEASSAEPGARLIDGRHRVVEPDLGLAAADRDALADLLARSDDELAGVRVDAVVPAHLLGSDFWTLWATTFRLRPGSGALDLKHSLQHHLPDPSRPPALAGLDRTRRSEYESIVRPLHHWLRAQGVAFTLGATVTDLHIAGSVGTARCATSLTFTTRGRSHTMELGERDHVLATLGCMTSNAAVGDDDAPPEPDLARRDATWRLWESLARAQPDFGRPDAFTAHVPDTAWLSFTLTSTTPDLHWYIGHLTGDPDGAGGPITFRDSPWLLTLTVPRRAHFTGQRPQTHTVLGYGMRLDVPGEHVPATLLRATGRQLVDELIGQLGLERRATTVRMNTRARAVLLPYAGSPLLPRRPGDRPVPVPAGVRNLAFLGQFAEIPGEVAFSMEYSVRSAMLAVYRLLGLDRDVPAPRRQPDAPTLMA